MPEPEAVILLASIFLFLVGIPAAISFGVYRLLRSRLSIGPWAFAGLAAGFWVLVGLALRIAGV